MSIRVKRRTEKRIDYLAHLLPFATNAGNPELKKLAKRLYAFNYALTTKEERENHFRKFPHPTSLPI